MFSPPRFYDGSRVVVRIGQAMHQVDRQFRINLIIDSWIIEEVKPQQAAAGLDETALIN